MLVNVTTTTNKVRIKILSARIENVLQRLEFLRDMFRPGSVAQLSRRSLDDRAGKPHEAQFFF